MVSFSLAAFLVVALAAFTQVVVALPNVPQKCNEIHPRSGVTRTFVKPNFHAGQTSNLNRKLFKAADGTVVKVKHLYQVQGGADLLLIKTKTNKKQRIQLDFQAKDGQKTSRFFKLTSNQSCYVPTETDEEAMSINDVHYYHKNN